MADRLAITNAKMNQGIKELSDGWDGFNSALDPSNEGTLEYNNALNSVRSSMKKVLGVNEDLSDDFIESARSSGKLQKAIEGD
ncbi:MAG: hypothetical protein IJD46_01155 [Bacilli bacterium]|nr:hypothetical protein [Bacilli bacterium]